MVLAVARRTPERCIVHIERSHVLLAGTAAGANCARICRAEGGDTAGRSSCEVSIGRLSARIFGMFGGNKIELNITQAELISSITGSRDLPCAKRKRT
jgi:hypothetical protein